MIKTKRNKKNKTHIKRVKNIKNIKNKTRKIYKKFIKKTKKNRAKFLKKCGGSKEGEDYTGLEEDSSPISTEAPAASLSENITEPLETQQKIIDLINELKEREIYLIRIGTFFKAENDDVVIDIIKQINFSLQQTGVFLVEKKNNLDNDLLVLDPKTDIFLPSYMEQYLPEDSIQIFDFKTTIVIDLLSAIYYKISNEKLLIILTQVLFNANNFVIEYINIFNFETPLCVAFKRGALKLTKFLIQLINLQKEKGLLLFDYAANNYYPSPNEKNRRILQDEFQKRYLTIFKGLPRSYMKSTSIVVSAVRNNFINIIKTQMIPLGIKTNTAITKIYEEIMLSKIEINATEYIQRTIQSREELIQSLQQSVSKSNPIQSRTELEPIKAPIESPMEELISAASVEPIVETKQKRKKKKKTKTKQGVLLGENPEAENDDEPDEQDEAEQIVPREEPVNEIPPPDIAPQMPEIPPPDIAIAQQHVVTELPPQSIAFWGQFSLDVNELKDTINSWMITSLQPKGENICSKIIQKFNNYSLLNKSELSQEDVLIYNIMSCATFIIIGTVLEKFSKSSNYKKYDLIVKGGKGLQLSFEEFVFKYNYESDDVDILLFDKSKENNTAEMLMISSEICNLVKWIIESASVSRPLFSNISTKLAEPNADPRDKTKSRYVSKITYINGPFKKVISEIDIKNPEEVDETEKFQLSKISFPLGINFYFPKYLVFTPYNFDSIQVAYIYQQIFEAFKEKTYIYTKYFLLKKIYIKLKGFDVAPPSTSLQAVIDMDEDIKPCNYFLKKFKKSINAIFYYLYTRFCQTALADPSFRARPDYSNFDKQLQIYRQLNASLRALQDIDNLEKLKNSNSRRLSPQQMGKISSKSQVMADIERYKAEERVYYLRHSQLIFSQNLFPGFESINYSDFGANLSMDVFDSIMN